MGIEPAVLDFTYEPSPVRVVFGIGAAAALPDELDRLGLRRPVVVCTPGRAGTVRERAWAAPPCRCTTSSATCSAAPSTCHTRACTR
ncbi:hypothetical protein K1W54_41330 [Micromonospora sp. CPCC 205371]|nr:hypothetical protein [Micromonospora sp. CPCC 205371]